MYSYVKKITDSAFLISMRMIPSITKPKEYPIPSINNGKINLICDINQSCNTNNQHERITYKNEIEEDLEFQSLTKEI